MSRRLTSSGSEIQRSYLAIRYLGDFVDRCPIRPLKAASDPRDGCVAAADHRSKLRERDAIDVEVVRKLHDPEVTRKGIIPSSVITSHGIATRYRSVMIITWRANT